MLLLLLLFEDFADLQRRHRVISAYKAMEGEASEASHDGYGGCWAHWRYIRGRNVVENLSDEQTIDVALIVDQSSRLR
jgi:hypothetical protein